MSEPAGKAAGLHPDGRARFRLAVNGHTHELLVEPRSTLLDVLRLELGLTGTKRGCDHGNCGACSVLVDGRAQYACLRLAVDCDEAEIVTIEGLAREGKLHPVQQAFISADALQCGFCTPGQIISAVGLLDQTPHPSDVEIQRAMSGNLCRCGAYANIHEAVRRASGRAR